MYSKWSVYSANFGGLHINHGSEGKLEWGGGGGGMTADGRGKVDNVISFSLSPLPSPVSCCFVSLPVSSLPHDLPWPMSMVMYCTTILKSKAQLSKMSLLDVRFASVHEASILQMQ